MLQSNYTVQKQGYLEERAPERDLSYYISFAKRRLFYFLIPFVVVLLGGLLIVAIQRSIYLAEGKILVESQDIPVDLVRPTVTDTANQRIQVIQQRIMTRDNLLTIVSKYGLFAGQRQWMSGTQLLDVMRERTKLQLVDLTRPTPGNNNLTIALTLSFEYENPEIAMRVANEFLTLILSEDARTRNSRAAETTKFLAREVKRLEDELAAVDAQLSELKRTPLTETADPTVGQMAALQAELAKKTAIYSDAHPDVKALKRAIAALQKTMTKTAQTGHTVVNFEDLERQRLSAEKNLEEANRKLAAARLGESLERDQQSERLQVIEQPALPQKPIKPNRAKLATAAFGIALVMGLGVALVAEGLDKSIRSSQALVGLVDKDLIVSIPYIWTAQETAEKRRRLLWALGIVAAILILALGAALSLGLVIDISGWLDRASMDTLHQWLDYLTRLTK